ncbi:hypothetical protein EDB81DRAFT_222640 [Dactylonectria macrodidyma]|uniref:Uncharacterized protein n=1 Tax=Dactylonectria macrodidyma TaxID=307937 RepID=A0A9P9II41_9HYPO|nr:hypothetical protein EDB81DRAFT_222640 [Dactylonectria macrodidyma]
MPPPNPGFNATCAWPRRLFQCRRFARALRYDARDSWFLLVGLRAKQTGLVLPCGTIGTCKDTMLRVLSCPDRLMPRRCGPARTGVSVNSNNKKHKGLFGCAIRPRSRATATGGQQNPCPHAAPTMTSSKLLCGEGNRILPLIGDFCVWASAASTALEYSSRETHGGMLASHQLINGQTARRMLQLFYWSMKFTSWLRWQSADGEAIWMMMFLRLLIAPPLVGD